MEIVLIRHGVTAWNQQRRFQGQIDTPLSEEGHQQAMLTARHLAGLHHAQPIAAIYASDLRRAWSTAEPIARLLGLPILKQSLLRERHYGIFEGKTHDELEHEGLQADYQRWRSREPDLELPQGGESLRAFFDRAHRALQTLVAGHQPGDRIVAVTHGGFLDCAYRIASDVDMSAQRQHPLHNASLNRMAFDGKRFSLIEWGFVDHLDSIDSRRD
ncbi:MAG: histidine phosphatase family protein [Betaproteobacteria bacterium]|nr:histidine phosphatase family protein [Betaproteobacteria bacterium]